MSMFDPPSGEADLASDAEEIEPAGPYRDLAVKGVGTVRARKPQPRSAHALAMAANSKIGASAQADYFTLFVRHHLDDDSYEDLLRGMVEGDYPLDAMPKVARELSVWGTARPTKP
ncbi:hypothetical protein PBI_CLOVERMINNIE_34 [Gordonia phage CloverMinnie]|nr:hypothetical protein PBI_CLOVERMINNIE_34 [Gordonia phage CloverMinnie]